MKLAPLFMRSFCLAIAAGLTFSSPAAAERRVALIIGNSNYEHGVKLHNPRNDAEAIAALLGAIGFGPGDITLKFDLALKEMKNEVRAFAQAAHGADAAVIYFAGHGIGASSNYAIPVDAKMEDADTLSQEAIDVNALADAVGRAAGVKLVILDACRNDPAAGEMKGLNKKRGQSRGFLPVEPTGGVAIAFSARHGTTARDGPPGGNSPYAAALLKHLSEPLEIRFVFGAVRDSVMSATKGAQEPFLYESFGAKRTFLVKPARLDDDSAGAAPDGQSARINAQNDTLILLPKADLPSITGALLGKWGGQGASGACEINGRVRARAFDETASPLGAPWRRVEILDGACRGKTGWVIEKAIEFGE